MIRSPHIVRCAGRSRRAYSVDIALPSDTQKETSTESPNILAAARHGCDVDWNWSCPLSYKYMNLGVVVSVTADIKVRIDTAVILAPLDVAR